MPFIDSLIFFKKKIERRLVSSFILLKKKEKKNNTRKKKEKKGKTWRERERERKEEEMKIYLSCEIMQQSTSGWITRLFLLEEKESLFTRINRTQFCVRSTVMNILIDYKE